MKFKKMANLVFAFALMCSLVPATALAAIQDEIDNQVRSATEDVMLIAEAGGGNGASSVTGRAVEAPTSDEFAITAPAGSTISVGKLTQYYKYNFLDASSVVTLDDESVRATFSLSALASLKGKAFYRVQNPEGVTYWNYIDVPEGGSSIAVTADELNLGSKDFNSGTIYRFEKNPYDLADIYLNVNARGHMNLAVGETFELNVFRNWMAIEGTGNAKTALPDMHYKVIDVEGNSSDVVSVEPGADNSSVATLTANKAGTAVVLVTYDAMVHKQGFGGKTQFSAIWPERTGVFVVTVGAGEPAVQTNMFVNSGQNPSEQKLSGDAIDAEHDPLFYVGEVGASYSFKPEPGCSVSIARPELTSGSLTYSGFTSEGVRVSEDGTVTLKGLTTGRNIVKVEKDGQVVYQVLTAQKVSYQLKDSEGNLLPDDYKATAGDRITVQFTGLTMPVEKASGVYNYNAKVCYYGEDGTRFPATKGGGIGSYTFSGSAKDQTVTVTIPDDWESDSYTLNGGAIQIGGFGSPAGAHRSTTYAAGKDVQFSALSMTIVLGQLPDIVIGEKPDPATYDVSLPKGEGYSVSPVEGFKSPVMEDGSYAFSVAIDEGYEKGSDFAVKANGVALEAAPDGTYLISYIDEDQNVTVEGVQAKASVEPADPIAPTDPDGSEDVVDGSQEKPVGDQTSASGHALAKTGDPIFGFVGVVALLAAFAAAVAIFTRRRASGFRSLR